MTIEMDQLIKKARSSALQEQQRKDTARQASQERQAAERAVSLMVYPPFEEFAKRLHALGSDSYGRQFKGSFDDRGSDFYGCFSFENNSIDEDYGEDRDLGIDITIDSKNITIYDFYDGYKHCLKSPQAGIKYFLEWALRNAPELSENLLQDLSENPLSDFVDYPAYQGIKPNPSVSLLQKIARTIQSIFIRKEKPQEIRKTLAETRAETRAKMYQEFFDNSQSLILAAKKITGLDIDTSKLDKAVQETLEILGIKEDKIDNNPLIVAGALLHDVAKTFSSVAAHQKTGVIIDKDTLRKGFNDLVALITKSNSESTRLLALRLGTEIKVLDGMLKDRLVINAPQR